MEDYNDLKKKVSDLTICIEMFTKGKEKFEKLLSSQRSPFEQNGIGYNHSNTFSKQTHFVKASSSLSHLYCTYCEKSMKNANIGRGENVKGGSSRERVGKGKRVASGVRAPQRFISVKEAADFEEWTRKGRKIAPGLKVDLNDMKVGDPIGVGKIYNKHTFKRLGFERNEKGMLVKGGQDESDEDNEDDESNKVIRFSVYKKIGHPILKTGRPIFNFTVKNLPLL
ncbi:hypothetical protein M9H77_12417 [Catharanthus roseus]|uniref:Uncharacterized protein n=1 Tax=Catharanthus roseus TaxID=4058 RepID=A0ACC0BHJ7_CATRO|nr:hypothetical protein M9H77_12417 [Catharanthus roseus]